MKYTIIHIITGLSLGGAELALLKHIKLNSGDGSRNHVVISLMSRSYLSDRFEKENIKVYHLNFKKSPYSVFRGLIYLKRLLNSYEKVLLHGWLYHGCLIASLGRFLKKGKIPVIWNIRHSLHDMQSEKPITRYVIKLLAKLSKLPDQTIYNSSTGVEHHVNIGFARTNNLVIHNSVAGQSLKFVSQRRSQIRRDLGYDNSTMVIGVVARYHFIKGYDIFIQAAKIVIKKFPDVRIMCIGTGVTYDNVILKNLIQEAGIKENIVLLGRIEKPIDYMCGLDVLCMPSRSEGFPNVLAEALSVGVPCVATDVGETAVILKNKGVLCKSNDPASISAGLIEVIENREHYQVPRREYILDVQKRFSEAANDESYTNLYQQLAEKFL